MIVIILLLWHNYIMSEFIFAQHAALLEQQKIKRQLAAAQVVRARRLERDNPDYVKDSSLLDYLRTAQGLLTFLNHARERGVPAILEIGSGTARAIGQLAQNQMGEGLSFVATGLTHRHIETPNVLWRPTPAEVLRGVDDKSVSGIIALSALGFSRVPELVVNNIDRTLVKGGAIKATFRGKESYGEEWDAKYDEWGYGPHDQFTTELRRRRYDVAVMETGGDDIMVAIRHTRRMPITARELLEQDAQTLPQQLELAA